MSKRDSDNMDDVIGMVAKVIAYDIEGLYELDFRNNVYRGIKCSDFLLQVFGETGEASGFLTRLLTGNSPLKESEVYNEFYITPEFMGRLYGSHATLKTENLDRNMIFLYFKSSDEKAYAFFYPALDPVPLAEKEPVKELALSKNYLYSMVVDLDEDICFDIYISEVVQAEQSRQHIKISYSGWRKSLASCILPEHRNSFLNNTESSLVRQKLKLFNRHSYTIQMHVLGGQTLWTLHTFLRIQDKKRDHLLFIYSVQDIDTEIRPLLEKNTGDDYRSDAVPGSPRTVNINAALNKTLQSLAPFSGLILEHVESEIRNNYMHKLSLKLLAGKYYINAAYLGQLFIQKYGVSFHDYLNAVRMEKAAYLLTGSSCSINQIAELCGIPNTNYFHRQFRKHYNCTPLEYKELHRGG